MASEEEEVTLYLYLTTEETLSVYAPDRDVAQYLADRIYEEARQPTCDVKRHTTSITLDGEEYPPSKQIPRSTLPKVHPRLFLLTYQGLDERLYLHPLYALHLDAAINKACAWLDGQPQYTYVSVRSQPEGREINAIFYPGERAATVSLYIAEYFVDHRVMHYPIYAESLDQAVAQMNAFYTQNGRGNAHKSLECHTAGREIDGTYYPPEKTLDTDLQ